MLQPNNGLFAIDDVLTIRGELQFADGRTEHKQVELQDIDSGWKIFVAEALMKDVVQPHFGEQVEIVGKRAKENAPNTLYLPALENYRPYRSE